MAGLASFDPLSMDEHAEAALEAMRMARDFPANTCGASRHCQLLAEAILRGEPCHQWAEGPQHCAESIAWTVAALWNARSEIELMRRLVCEQACGAKE